MKNGKLHKSGILKILLGLVAAGALLFASCQNIFDIAEQKSPDDGYGYVIVDLGDSARTTRPDIEKLQKFEYIFKGENLTLGTTDNTISYLSDTTTTDPFRLPAGKYTLTVKAYAVTAGTSINGVAVAATGVYSGTPGGVFEVVAGTSTLVLNVVLTPNETLESTGTDPGKLTITITVPANATAIYELKQISGAGNTLYEYSFSNPIIGNNFPGAITNMAFHAGTYLFTGRISTTDAKYGGFSEAIHIVGGMTTTFTRNYSTTGADLLELAAINNKEEAIELLEADLKSWITAKNADGTPKPLTTVSGQDKVTVAGTKTTFNYVASNLTTAGEFPLKLLGGWNVVADAANPGTANGTSATSNDSTIWYVGDSSATTKFRLVNTAVKTNATNANTAKPGSVPTITGDVEYFVELVPVAEYSLSFDTTVLSTETANRSVTVTTPEGANILTAPADIGQPKNFIGTVDGTTTITMSNAAITIRKDAEVKGTPFADGATFTPASSKYEIKVYQDKISQVRAAFERLQRELTSTITGNSFAPWVDNSGTTYSPYKALTRSPSNETASATMGIPGGPGAPEFTASADVNTAYGAWDTVTLYYVASRLAASPASANFTINVPITDDGRWEASGDWTQSVTTGGSKTIYFRPFGGDPVPYTIIYKPVAEVYASFVESTYGGGEGVYTYPSTSAVLLEDQGTSKKSKTFKETDGSSGDFAKIGAATNPYNGTKFILGATDFTLTDVTIMIDATTQSTTFAYANFDFFTTAKGPIAQSDTTNPDYPANNAAIAQGGTNKITVPLTSREYHINVYRKIADQIKDAQDEMKLETSATAWGAVDASTTAIYSYTSGSDTISLAPPTATTAPGNITSKVVYAGTKPTITVRDESSQNPPGPDFSVAGKGWKVLAALTPPANDTGAETIPLSFTPKGGLEDNNGGVGQYRIDLVPALRYKITFMKYPIGNSPLTGNFTVGGKETGTATNIPTPYRPHDETDNGKTFFIGLGDLTLKATGANVVLTSTTSVTGTAADYISNDTSGDMTITAPTLTAGVLAAPASTFAPIEIKVYPSITDQKANFLANMKAINRLTFAPWTSSPALTSNSSDSSFVVDTTPASDANNTLVRIVSNDSGATKIPTIGLPGSNAFLNTGYPLTLQLGAPAVSTLMGTIVPDNTLPTSGSDEDKAIAFGIRDIPVNFAAVCATPSATANKETYTFKLLAVAEYRFQPMNLPTTALSPTTGSYGIDVQVIAYAPGKTGLGRPATGSTVYPDELPINITQGTTQLTGYYRGIGTFADAADPTAPTATEASAGRTRIISRYNNGKNVFKLDSAPVTIDDTTVGGATAAATSGTVVSKVYNVRIYPSVPEQVADVRRTLNNLAGKPAAGWFTLPAGAILTTDNFAAGSTTGDTNTLEVQYMGLNAPIFSATAPSAVPPGILLATNSSADGYSYALPIGTNFASTTTTGVQEATINFTPTGPSAAVTNPIFKIRIIPVTKYIVTYKNGATGSVIITPKPATIVPGSELTINSTSAVKEGFRGLSQQTEIQISSTAGAYDEVQIRKTGSTSSTVIVDKEPVGGGLAPVNSAGVPTPYVHNNATSEAWEIVVIKN